jgi:hypothetical protein
VSDERRGEQDGGVGSREEGQADAAPGDSGGRKASSPFGPEVGECEHEVQRRRRRVREIEAGLDEEERGCEQKDAGEQPGPPVEQLPAERGGESDDGRGDARQCEREPTEELPDGEDGRGDRGILRIEPVVALDEEPGAERVFDGRPEEEPPVQEHLGLLEVDALVVVDGVVRENARRDEERHDPRDGREEDRRGAVPVQIAAVAPGPRRSTSHGPDPVPHRSAGYHASVWSATSETPTGSPTPKSSAWLCRQRTTVPSASSTW